MRIVPLAAAPNQSFSVTLDGARWALVLKEARGVMCVDISRDGVQILTGSRVLAGETLIPYRYLQSGNFVFLSLEDELPDWRNFGALVYLNALEIAAIGPTTAGEIIAAQYEVEYLFTDEGFYITTDNGDLIQNA